MLRTILFYPFFIPFSLIISICTTIAGMLDKSGKMIRYWSCLWGRGGLWAARVQLELDLSALDTSKNYIFMFNHQSQVDILTAFGVLGDFTAGFVSKQSLFKIPFFGRAMYASGSIPVDRSNRRRAMKSIDAAVVRLQEGTRSLIIFPEGTRSNDLTKLQEFHTGGLIMALRSGLPVAPIVIVGSGEILPKGAWFFHPTLRRLRVKALPPIDPAKYTIKQREQFKQDLYDMMNSTYLEMRRQ